MLIILKRFPILYCYLTHVKLCCIVHPSLTFWRFWPSCLLSYLLVEFSYSTYSTYQLQVTFMLFIILASFYFNFYSFFRNDNFH
ncbi:hypothetical protein Hanom_Chr16g01430551 [Helianthus anomalus]